MKEKLVKFVGNTKRKAIKNAPTICLVTGAGVGLVGLYLLRKAAKKEDEVLKPNVEKIHDLHKKATENGEKKPVYSPEDRKELHKQELEATGKVLKLYAGPAIALTVSFALFVKGHNIQKARYAALAASYTALDTSFKVYRNRVAEKFGEEAERAIRYGEKTVENKTTVMKEDGTVEEVVEKTTVQDNAASMYARFFDESCDGYIKNGTPEMQLMFIKQQLDWANRELRAKGFLTLNEVYGYFGIKPSSAGARVGWVYKEKDRHGRPGDGFITCPNIKACLEGLDNRYQRGEIKYLLLDFNVDGEIDMLIDGID